MREGIPQQLMCPRLKKLKHLVRERNRSGLRLRRKRQSRKLLVISPNRMPRLTLEMKRATITKRNTKLLLQRLRQREHRAEEHVPSLLNRLNENKPLNAARPLHKPRKPAHKRPVHQRLLTPQKTHPIRGTRLNIKTKLREILKIPRPMVIILKRVDIDHLLVNILCTIRAQDNLIKIAKTQNKKSHARIKREALPRMQSLIPHTLKKRKPSIVALPIKNMPQNVFQVSSPSPVYDSPGIPQCIAVIKKKKEHGRTLRVSPYLSLQSVTAGATPGHR